MTAGLFMITAFLASGCVTNNFCTTEEKSRILFATEPGVSEYYSTEEEAKALDSDLAEKGYWVITEKVFENNDNLWRRIEVNNDGLYTKSAELGTIIRSAVSSKISRPSNLYFSAFDTRLLEVAIEEEGLYNVDTITAEQVNNTLTNFGYVKFIGSEDDLWGNYDAINGDVSKRLEEEYPNQGYELLPSTDFISLYKSTLNTFVNNKKSCIATVEGTYGNYGKTYSDQVGIAIEAKDWGYAWRKGPISGLIVYPVAWLTDTMALAFSGGVGTSAMQSGWPQLLALVIVTIIVRLFIFGVTFKSVLSQQKMTALQPELAKIQAKYPNANTNQAEKQRMAEEQMKLYKKHKVNPMSQLLVIIVQFPIFIGVWGAMNGSAVLSTGTFLGLDLSTSISTALQNVSGLPSNVNGWWTALVLFILMSAAQFFSMKIPQWISNKRAKKISRLGKNPAADQQSKTMKIVTYGMLILIIFMGFTLPAAMGVYWLVGALFSLAQSLLTQLIVSKKKHKK